MAKGNRLSSSWDDELEENDAIEDVTPDGIKKLNNQQEVAQNDLQNMEPITMNTELISSKQELSLPNTDSASKCAKQEPIIVNTEPNSMKQEPSTVRQQRPEPKHRNFKVPRELRSKKAGFLMRPSLYERLRRIAELKGKTMNDIIDVIISAYCDEEEKKIPE